MVSKQQVLALLPPTDGNVGIANWGQSIKVIGKEIVKAHEQYMGDYNKIYKLFDRVDIHDTCSGLWDFCKYNMRYRKEGNDEQSVKSPALMLQPGQTVDCKHYTLFIAGVLDAIKCNEGDKWDWCFRMVSERADGQIGHIYPTVFDKDREMWVDPVMMRFDEFEQWTNYKDIYVDYAGIYT